MMFSGESKATELQEFFIQREILLGFADSSIYLHYAKSGAAIVMTAVLYVADVFCR